MLADLRHKLHVLALVGLCLVWGAVITRAATFTNNASIQVNDPTSSLTSTSGTFTVSCWFRISLPSSLMLSDNMDILMDRSDGNESASFSYLLRYNYTNNAVEFVTHGSSSQYSKTLIQNPYLERWYHLAISRSGSSFSSYVDGRPVLPSDNASVGNTAGSGVAVGGISGNSKQFYGDIIEVAIYSSALSQSIIQQRMFQDQHAFSNLKGYYKLAYSTNAADFYHNFAASPPTGTDPATPSGSGSITFDQVDQAGEQSIFDATKNHGENALTPLSGAFAWQQSAFARPVPGIAFDLKFGYSSALPTQAPTDGSSDPYDQRVLGPGWRQGFDTRVVVGSTINEIDLLTWDGALEAWTRTNQFGSLSTRHKEYRGELVQRTDTAEIEWTTPERIVYRFRDPSDGTVMAGRLEQIHDFDSNVVQILWDEDEAVVTNVIDTAGGSYQFNYDSLRQLLTNVTFGSWQVNFTYDSTNRLVSKALTNTSGTYININTTWQFQYDTNSLLASIIDPRSNTNALVQYDRYGRKTNEVDAIGRPSRTEYNVPQVWQMRHTDAAGLKWIETCDHKGHVLQEQDPLSDVTSYTYDTNGNRISTTEPLGWKTTSAYDARANVTNRTDALGNVTTWVIHPFFNKLVQQITPQPADATSVTTWSNFYAYDSGGNLTNHSDALGTLVSYTYFTNGLVHTSTDANFHTTIFGYDSNGFLNSVIDPATNPTSYTLNDVGWKLHQADALGNPTSYSYDLNGNAIRTLDAIGRVFNRAYDANGNLLSSSDGKGILTTYAYDAANQKTNMTDRTGTNKWTYAYTTRGKLDHITDPISNTVSNSYDSANRLIAVTDPMGNSVTNQYDANGNVFAVFDKLGQRWVKTYDRLNRVVAYVDPLGDSKDTTYDVAGRIQQITTPNGYPSLHVYDGRGRLIQWTDPQNFVWRYDYDGVGNITNITDALSGHYIMAYGSRNERILEHNQDSFEWHYTYDELLRLKQQTDPNTVVRTPTYDNVGRVLFVNFSTGRQDSFSPDPNDNLQTISHRVSGITTATQFIYDSLDRVIEQDDALNQTVLYGYDALGRVTTITYPGSKTLTNHYDPLGRLTNQVDWAGHQTIYNYDLANRLVGRTYPNGVIQTNSFDTAGRITGLSYQSNPASSNSIAAALTYAYDRNGNKTGSSETGTFLWPLPSLTDDTSSFTAAGRLITRQTQNNSAASNQLSSISYHYDPSGNMTNATGEGQSWTLAYDEDNRTTSIDWELQPLTSKLVTNRYDALGRRISKTVNGVTSGYVLDLSSGMERILCDLDGNGNITARYVHGPDLCYRVDATNGLICYHADAMGNVVALTDGNTNLVVQYAYTPYGRSLGSTNLQSQVANPYLFVGSQGVTEESDIPDLYFMRARYYSADVGVFLSTDPVKKIGPGWKPSAYEYANTNPYRFYDASGKAIDPLTSWAIGAFSEVLTEDADELTVELAADSKVSQQQAQTAVNVKNLVIGVQNLNDDLRGLNNGTEDPVNYIAGQFGALSGQVIFGFSKFLATSVYSGGAAIGNQLHDAIYGQGGNGTTPMPSLPKAQTTTGSLVTGATAAGAVANNVSAMTSTKATGASGGSGSTSGSTSITIPKGATLSGIAQQYGTTVSSLVSINNISNPNVIYAGATLKIK
jgi:RHS repeat-associated protein